MEEGELARSRSRSSTSSGSRSRSRSGSPSVSRSRSRSRSSSRSRSRGRTRNRRVDSASDSTEAVVEEARLLLDAGVIKFCEEHKADLAVSSCVTCRLVSRTVRGPVLPELIRLVKAQSAAAAEIPDAVNRFASRIDEKPATLTLSESDMALAESLFGRGKMSPPTMFDELTREFLFLPQNQNETLTKSVQLEKMLLKFKKDKVHSNVFQYVEQMAKVAKHLRISERPIVLAMGELARLMNAVKMNGKNLGFLYPAQGPVVQLMGPRKFRDQLAYTNLPILPLPLPSLDSLVKDTSVSPQDKEQIAANLLAAEQVLKEHARDLSNKLGLFMDTVAGGVNRLDSFLGFHMDLFGHCDGEVTDLMRDKAATLFSPPYRSAVKGRSGDGGKAGDGLLGGETAVRSRLTDATKEDELLAKTVHKGFKGARKNYRGNQKSKGAFLFVSCFFTFIFLFQERGSPDQGLGGDPGPDLGPGLDLLGAAGTLGLPLALASRMGGTRIKTTRRSRTRTRTRLRRRRILPSLPILQVRTLFLLLPLLLLKLGIHLFSLRLLCSY